LPLPDTGPLVCDSTAKWTAEIDNG
jgi:hypothetical protein